MINGKGGIEWELKEWIIVLVLLALIVASIILLKDKLWQIGDYIKDFLRFG